MGNNSCCLLQDGGWTALHHACSGGQVKVVSVLWTAGAKVDVQDLVSCLDVEI
jgi:ankyrin repeat protein